MQARRWRLAVLLILAVSGGTLFQGLPGCVTFSGQGFLSSVDFCFLLDCQGGLFFGLLRPCGDPTTRDDDLLQDCPAPIGGGA